MILKVESKRASKQTTERMGIYCLCLLFMGILLVADCLIIYFIV